MQTLPVYQRQKPEEGEATECRLCKHSGCILNTDYTTQVNTYIASLPGLNFLLKSSKNGEGGGGGVGGENLGLVTSAEKSCWRPSPCKADCRTKTCTHDRKWTYKHRLYFKSWLKKQLSDVRASPENLISKLTVVGLQDWFTHHTYFTALSLVRSEKCVMKLDQQSCGCTEDKEWNCK